MSSESYRTDASENRFIWEIKDTEGRVVAEHVRFDKPDGKDVKWRLPGGSFRDGLKGRKLKTLPLYGSEKLVDWQEDHPVVVVEGEKAADALHGSGIILTLGTVTGAGDTPGAEPLEVLRGREVILWPDADEPGRKHMRRVAENLQGVAASVSVYDWPEAEEKDDAADHPAVIEGNKKARGILLNELLGAPLYQPPKEASGSGHGPKRKADGSTPSFNQTDQGNAERFAHQHGRDVRYCHPQGRWYVYDGARWQTDRTGEIERRAKTTARGVYAEASNPDLDSVEARALASHAARSEAKNRLDAMIALARSEPGIPVLPEEMDADPWMLNCENGTVDLRTGGLEDHDPDGLITKLSPVGYDPDARAPAFEGFLRKVLPSESLRRFVQRLVGYGLTGDVSEQVMGILYGPGANGKSTLINVVLEMMGDYGKSAAPDLLMAKHGSHPTELADLFGARLVAAQETEDGRRLAEGLVKQLTGGDRIKARYMRQDFWEFDPTHKVWLATNHKPDIRGTDHAIWRRIRLIPFDVIIPKEEQDHGLPERLRSELPGILAWAVEGCLAWQREGLGEPAEVRTATEGYRAEQDLLAAFFEECCVIREGTWAPFKDLYAAYAEWAEESGERTETKRKFGTRLTERGLENGRGTDNIAIRRGVGLLRDGGPGRGGLPK